MKDSLKFIGMALFIIFIIFVLYNNLTDYDGSDLERDYDKNPITSTINPFPECNQSSKAARSLCKLSAKVEVKKEAKIKSRADESNQYNNLEECLNDNKEIDSTKTRAEWCDSGYVLIKSSDTE